MTTAYSTPLYISTEALLLELRKQTSAFTLSNLCNDESEKEVDIGKLTSKIKRDCSFKGCSEKKRKLNSRVNVEGCSPPVNASTRVRYPDVRTITASACEKTLSKDIFDNISDDGVDLDDKILLSDEKKIREASNSGIKFDDSSKSSEDLVESEGDFRIQISGEESERSSSFSSTNGMQGSRRRLNQIVPYPRKPRQADYSCSVCGEGYQCTVNENPWWAVYKHACPHCKQFQIPRIDIGVSSNAIELDPNVIALYGEGIEDSGDDDDELDSVCFDGDEDLHTGQTDSEDELNASSTSGDDFSSSINERSIDHEDSLGKEEVSKLFILMAHARSCDGEHSSDKHDEICRSTKFLMLHIRDCKGADVKGRMCQFPWCQPCKRMLNHLSHCFDSPSCLICRPRLLPDAFFQLNSHGETGIIQTD